MPFAPDAAYGRPEDLKRLIDEAHERELMVFLDVVYNHFGPEGNYLHRYAPGFFEPDEHTPWGAAINYKQRAVRDFAIHNVLYWLEEYRFDGLRFDAVDRIIDRGEEHVLKEIAATVRRTIPAERHVHLVLENDANQAHLLERDGSGRPVFYDAQWNDDIHHVYHHLLTGDAGGYYADYASGASGHLAKALTSGFVFQGDVSEYRDGAVRGEPSGHLPPTAFVAFLQNHDQVGNRAFGERIAALAPFEAVQAMQAVLLLAPNVPLLFMGEEWGATQPFCFFTDFHDELADAVREGRRREFQKFPEFASEAARAHIPDPNALSTFTASRLDWSAPEDQPEHAEWLALVRELLRIRHETIVPRLAGMQGGAAEATLIGTAGIVVTWTLGDGARLTLVANLGDQPERGFLPPEGEVVFATRAGRRARRSRRQAAGLVARLVPGGRVMQHRPPPGIPRATYRLQFNAGFGFTAARAIVPYLAKLGISHLYASPLTRARPELDPRLRRHRLQPPQSRARRRGRVRGAGRDAARARDGPPARLRAQPHGRRLRQSLVARRARMGPAQPLRHLLRHRLGGERARLPRQDHAAGARRPVRQGAGGRPAPAAARRRRGHLRRRLFRGALPGRGAALPAARCTRPRACSTAMAGRCSSSPRSSPRSTARRPRPSSG